MARKNIALLSLDETVTAERVEAEDVQEIEQSATEIDSDKEVIEEAEETSETIGEIAERVEGSEEGITEETAEVVKVAVEHFCARVGYSTKKLGVAVESFGVATRKEKSIQLAKDLRIAKESIDKQIAIAQEGLWDKIKNKFDRIFTTRDKLAMQLKTASNAYDSKGRSESLITGKYMSVYLNPEGREVLTGKEAIKNLEKLIKVLDSKEILDIAEKLAKLTNDAIDTLVKEKNNPESKSAGLVKLSNLLGEVSDLVKEAKEIFDTKPTKSTEGSLVPVEENEKDKLVKLIETSLNSSNLNDQLSVLWKKAVKLEDKSTGEIVLTQGRQVIEINDASEMIAKKLVKETDKIWYAIDSLDTMVFNVAHSAVRYIELSTAK